MSVEYWVWLQQVLGYANQATARVIEEYGTARAFYQAEDREKIMKCGLTPAQVKRLHTVPRRTVYHILQECKAAGIAMIPPESPEYPEKLRHIPEPPAVLYLLGKQPRLNKVPVIAIVGPRKISEYGRKCAHVIAGTLASCGFTIVSGTANGGDSAAHLGAIEAGSLSVAVPGGGVLKGYPAMNADIVKRISSNGCLISEYPPSTPSSKQSYSQRNRIISGLSDGVVVIEGKNGSGTLSTARYAAEQSRDVFVIPGSPSDPHYEGSNRLLIDGAKPLLTVNDIISEYIHLYPDVIHEPQGNISISQTPKPENLDMSGLSESARQILKTAAGMEEFSPDDIAESAELDAGTLLGAFTELELREMIKAVPGGRFRLN